MKGTEPYTYTIEECYDCPYCGETQGWSEMGFDEEDYQDTHFCNKCRKEFKLLKTAIKCKEGK